MRAMRELEKNLKLARWNFSEYQTERLLLHIFDDHDRANEKKQKKKKLTKMEKLFIA